MLALVPTATDKDTPMAATDDARALGALAARVEAIEREQARMASRQDEIIHCLQAIRRTLDRAEGGMAAGRWVAGFLGLGSMSGIIAFFGWLGGFLHK
jgi:hypothetical protein